MFGLNHLMCEPGHTDDSLSAHEQDNKPQLDFGASSVEHGAFNLTLPLLSSCVIVCSLLSDVLKTF